jgi:hypothetical protein
MRVRGLKQQKFVEADFRRRVLRNSGVIILEDRWVLPRDRLGPDPFLVIH